MFLLLDNQDSFVHNLARYLRLAGADTRVVRSDAVTASEVAAMNPAAIVLSPGPHAPADAGCCLRVAERLAGQIPMLGVCLGHQTIAAAAGATIDRCPPMHGMASSITHDGVGCLMVVPGESRWAAIIRCTLPPRRSRLASSSTRSPTTAS